MRQRARNTVDEATPTRNRARNAIDEDAPPRARIPLCLMAKAPRAGAVKTRMQPQLAPAQSAELAHLMLRQTAAAARRHWPGAVTLCVWPDGAHPAFAALAAEHRLTVTRQADADLGARMLHAMRPGIARAGAAAVIGCDVPQCPGDILAAAHALLARGENPLGAARDGGFYLLGLGRDALRRFDDRGETLAGIAWGGADAAAQVRARAQAVGVSFAALPTLRDIDRYADLMWLADKDDAYRRFVGDDSNAAA